MEHMKNADDEYISFKYISLFMQIGKYDLLFWRLFEGSLNSRKFTVRDFTSSKVCSLSVSNMQSFNQKMARKMHF